MMKTRIGGQRRARRPRQRSGFTLIELLVVISIIATLMSLILPAIQNAREAGRRTQCLNNIRNVTVAALNYASSSSKGHLPSLSYYPPAISPPGSFLEGRSWVVELLPYMDQQGTYDRWNKDLAWDDPANLSLASDLSIEALACPNDESAFATPGGLTYVANSGFGTSKLGATAATQLRGHTFFDAALDWNSNGTPSDPEDEEITFRTGVFWPHFGSAVLKDICSNRCFSPGKIYDGSSNTLMLAENINAGDTNWANPALPSCGFIYPLNGGSATSADSTRASAVLLGNTPTGVRNGERPYPNQMKIGPEGTPYPNSNHPGIVVVSMCDGSSRSISEGIDEKVYTKLITPDATKLRALAYGGGVKFIPESPLSSDSL